MPCLKMYQKQPFYHLASKTGHALSLQFYTPPTSKPRFSAGSFALWSRSALLPMLRHCSEERAYPDHKISHLKKAGFSRRVSIVKNMN